MNKQLQQKSTSTKKSLQNKQSQVFILWGENFDGQMATAFATKFRSSGLKVRIIGLRGKQARGRYGIKLVPDMPLSQAMALAERADCVVIPCHSPYLGQIDNDPRVQDFFQRTSKNHAHVVTGQARLSDLDRLTGSERVMHCLEYSEVDHSVNMIKERLL